MTDKSALDGLDLAPMAPTVESDGLDRKELFQKSIKGMMDEVRARRDETRREHEEAKRRAQYDIPDELWMRCVRRNGKEGERDTYTCTAISGLPEGAHLQVVIEEIAHLESEVRFAYLQVLLKSGVKPEQARPRAARTRVSIADLVR